MPKGKPKQLISKKEAYARQICIKCGQRLNRTLSHGQGNTKYHLECSSAIQYVRSHNLSKHRRAAGGEPKCIICEKSMSADKLNKSGMCAKCAKLVKEREEYNINLKKSIDWEAEARRKKTDSAAKATKRKVLPCNDAQLRMERRSPYKDSCDLPPDNGKHYNNPAARKLDNDPRYNEIAPVHYYDTVDAEGRAIRVEVRGQGFCAGRRFDK